MEPLSIEDINRLTRLENELIQLRKREAANINSPNVIDQLTEVIKECHELRQWLQSRFNLKMDPNL